MALQKQPVTINFTQGLDTKSDPKQVAVGKFLSLENSVFDKQGALTKRNGYPLITTLPNADQTTLTTLNGNLLATGSNLYAYSADTDQWLNQGSVQPVDLDVLPLVRISSSQTSPDAATAANGLTCLVYMDGGASYYHVIDGNTGQQVVARTALPSSAVNPRVVLLNSFFIISFLYSNSGTPTIACIAIPATIPADASNVISLATGIASTSIAYDTLALNSVFYVAYTAADGTMKLRYMATDFAPSAATSLASIQPDLISLAGDPNHNIWVSYYISSTNTVAAACYTPLVEQIVTGFPVTIATSVTLSALSSVSTTDKLTIFLDNTNHYAYDSSLRSDYISVGSVTIGASVTAPVIVRRSVGLASKPFVSASGTLYAMVVYGGQNQPTYFLMDASGNLYMRLAYSNGGGYPSTQVLPNVTDINETFWCPYLIKDFLTTVNKGTNLASGTPVNAIYTQTGVNMAKFAINTSGQYSSEIANTLHLTGGQLWQYDSVKPVEHGFHVWPEDVEVSTSTSGGSIGAGTYYYVFTYEWTDNQGMLHRSAPSIPVSQVTTGSSSTNTLHVPTLRLTEKVSPNPVRIVGYRWSVAQQVYYQFTSVTSPTLNDTTVDSVTVTDTLADSAILGQNILYTTGNVIENIAAPASKASALYRNRLWLIDAEDQNLLWYSKQVIEGVPVEMSDLLTYYVAPTSGAQGSTGYCRALGAMDDKLIIFKKDAIYYVTGNGPDNTGANNDLSDPIFITGSVGCTNPSSIVLMPQGLMFQSDKGIWLLGRDLNTQYIGAPVEGFNSATVKSAAVIPGTNQVRFVLDTGITLMYDYYYQQWGTFTNISAVSATLYQSLHTYLNAYGLVFQEKANTYLDGSRPVLMSFTTSWISLAGLQGFERFYFMYLLGTYFSPFKLNVGLAYDFNPSSTHNVEVVPDNYSGTWGSNSVYGGGTAWGGTGNVFEARLFPNVQKCSSLQISVQETYDASYGIQAGQGLSLSGLNIVIGAKKGYRTQRASRSFG